MKILDQFKKAHIPFFIDAVIFGVAGISFLWWFSGKGLFYSDTAPVMSPFTSLSLMGLSGVRIADA